MRSEKLDHIGGSLAEYHMKSQKGRIVAEGGRILFALNTKSASLTGQMLVRAFDRRYYAVKILRRKCSWFTNTSISTANYR